MNTPVPTIARVQAHALIGAHANDPVLPDDAPRVRRQHAAPLRRVTANGLHRLAEAVAPAPHRSGRHA